MPTGELSCAKLMKDQEGPYLSGVLSGLFVKVHAFSAFVNMSGTTEGPHRHNL